MGGRRRRHRLDLLEHLGAHDSQDRQDRRGT
jgi:hypothetical protein